MKKINASVNTSVTKETTATPTTNGEVVVKKADLVKSIEESYRKLTEKSGDNKLKKSLTDRVGYTLKSYEKDPKSVAKDILVQLAEDIQTALEKVMSAPASTPAPVEASSKPKLSSSKGKDSKTQPKADPKPAPAPAPKAPAPNAPAPAKETPAPAPKKPTLPKKKVETAPEADTKKIPMAKLFPDTLENEDYGTLTVQSTGYTSMKELSDAVESGKTLVIATYWTKRHIKEFEYEKSHDVPVPKDGFPNDLDLLQVIYVCSGIPRLYAISTYTEAIFYITEEDLTRVECEAADKSKFTMRYSAGMEFEIYEAESSADDDEDEESDEDEDEESAEDKDEEDAEDESEDEESEDEDEE